MGIFGLIVRLISFLTLNECKKINMFYRNRTLIEKNVREIIGIIPIKEQINIYTEFGELLYHMNSKYDEDMKEKNMNSSMEIKTYYDFYNLMNK